MERCEKGKKGSCLRAGKLSSLPGLVSLTLWDIKQVISKV